MLNTKKGTAEARVYLVDKYITLAASALTFAEKAEAAGRDGSRARASAAQAKLKAQLLLG